MKATHSQQLERWLGTDEVDRISKVMENWYGPPISVHGVPGNVRAVKGGDFIGEIRAGYELSKWDQFEMFVNRMKKAWKKGTRTQHGQLNAGFSSLSELIQAATTGTQRQEMYFQKTGSAGVAAASFSLWSQGTHPAAATAAAAAAPGGSVLTSATQGALPLRNAGAGDTIHFTTGNIISSVAGNTLLLYDRLFSVNKTASSTASQAVTGVPIRYQSTSPGDPDSAEGNFLFVEVNTTLGATAHNWTTVTYKNQLDAASTMPSIVGSSGAIANRIDSPLNYWFFPLAAGHTGVKNLTQMQCSASVTGSADFVIGHPIAFMPCPIANLMCIQDGINTAFNLTRIFDGACLTFMEMCKPNTTATAYTGSITVVSG